MNPAEPEPVLTYRADDVRLFLDCVLADRLHRGFWLTRLMYNATIEGEDSYYRWARRRIELGHPTPKRLGRARINAGLSEARNESPEYRQFPVTTLRLAADEARLAIDGCIARRVMGEKPRNPRFRSARGRQQIRFVQFGTPEFRGDKIVVEIMGLGRIKARMHRDAPEHGTLKEIRFQKDLLCRIRMQLVWTYPEPEKQFDPTETGRILHAALRHLPQDSAPGQILDAVADLPVLGLDLGLTNPVTTHTGKSMPRVAVSRSTSAKHKALQQSIARKTQKRSKRRRKLVLRLRRLQEAHARKSKTRALQDAAMVVRGQRLVATEPNDMVRRLMGQIADSRRNETDPKRARMLRRRLHETGLNRRLNQIKRLCSRTGALHLMPEYRGTSQRCSGCGAWVPKGLWVRTHVCVGCGAPDEPWRIGRDHNAGRNILAEALRSFIDSADPGGLIQALLDVEAERVAEAIATREKRRTRAIESWNRRGRRGSRRDHHPAEHQIELVPG